MRFLSLLFFAIALSVSPIPASAGSSPASPIPPTGGGFTSYINGQEIRCTFIERELPRCVSSAPVRGDNCYLELIGARFAEEPGFLRARCTADPRGDIREFIAGTLKDMSAFCPSLPYAAAEEVIQKLAGQNIRELTRFVFMVFGNQYSARVLVPGVTIAIQQAPYWPYPIDGYLRFSFMDQRVICEVLMDMVDLSPEPVEKGGGPDGPPGL